jgi:hypothetical protein
LVLPEEKRWLNCSTFVLTVFKSAGPRLIDASGWPDRPEEDRAWQAQLVEWLSKEASPEHIARVSRDIGRARIRPEETSGACLEESLPTHFEQCEPNGKAIMQYLDKESIIPPRPTRTHQSGENDLARPEHVHSE